MLKLFLAFNIYLEKFDKIQEPLQAKLKNIRQQTHKSIRTLGHFSKCVFFTQNDNLQKQTSKTSKYNNLLEIRF